MHNWILQKPVFDYQLMDPPKSDVYFCDRCHQLILSAVDYPVDESPEHVKWLQIEDCDLRIVKMVMDS